MTPQTGPGSTARRFAEGIVRWRWAALILSILVALGAASGARFLTFDANYRVWFSEENPELANFEAIQNIYTRNDSILFVITPEGDNAFTPEVMEAVEALTLEAWQIPWVRRVDSPTNFQNTRAEGWDLVVADLVAGAGDLSQSELDLARETAMAEPALYRRLVSEDGRVVGVNAVLQLPGADPDELLAAVDTARALRASIIERWPGLEIRLGGVGMLNNAFVENSKDDLAFLTPIMFAVLFAVLFVLLRSLAGMLGAVLVVLLSSAAAMGLAGWAGIALTGPSATAPTVIMTLAVADSVHILITLYHGMRQGLDRHAAIIESLRVNMQPVFLTSATTAVGFLSMNFSDAPPFRDFGNITAVGVGIAFVLAVVMLPALMAILPLRAPRGQSPGQRMMDRLAGFVVARRQPLLWGGTVVILGFVAFIPQIELNDEFVRYFSQNIEYRRDADYTNANLTGVYALEYSVPAAESGGISDPAWLARLDGFAVWLREQPEVVQVSTLSDVFRRINRSMNRDDPAYYTLPEGRDLTAQYLLLYELSLPYGLDLNDTINVDKSATRVTVVLRDLSAVEMRAFAARADAWVAAELPPEMMATSSGPSLMFANISGRNIRSMLSGTALALLIISALLILALRSLRIGVLSLVPNVVPAAMAFGLWGLMVGQVNMAVSVIAAISLGIVVDDTIHFLSRYLRARRERGYDPAQAVHHAFTTVGMALTVTTLVLVAGFAVLAMSDFALNASLGLLTAIAIAFALLVDFLFLPPLLMKMEEKGHVVVKTAPAE